MMDLFDDFLQRLKKFSFINKETDFLLAVSGGADSVVLTNLFFKAGKAFTIVHCNFNLRGAESDRDEMFVRSLGEKYNCPVIVKSFNTRQYATEKKQGTQEAARNLRYTWFIELLNEKHLKQNDDASHKADRWLCTAHHADDNIETLLINFFRGTGILGLTGIPETDIKRKILRPVLFATHSAILEYAQNNQLKWVEDSSNATENYTRNFLRHSVIPVLEKNFGSIKENLLNNIQRFSDAQVLYQQAIENHRRNLLVSVQQEFHIPILKLLKSSPVETIVFEIISTFNFSPAQVPEVLKLCTANTGSYMASTTHRIIKNRKWLIIAPLLNAELSIVVINENENAVDFYGGKLEIKKMDKLPENYPTVKSNIAFLDATAFTFPLIIRKWKTGDYFYPLGMQKKKKLSRFFIDQKLSATQKEKIWVVESDKKILWVVGYRIDDRFKLKPSSQHILQLTFHEK